MSSHLKRLSAIAVSGLFACSFASASTVKMDFDVNLQAGFPKVEDLMIITGDGSISRIYQTGYSLQSTMNGVPSTTPLTLTIDEPSSFAVEGLMLGVARGFATDDNPDQEHLVVVHSTEASNKAKGVDFSTFYGKYSYLEEDFIYSLRVAAGGCAAYGGACEDDPDYDPWSALLTFADTYARHANGMDGGLGIDGNTWFTIGLDTVNDLSVIAFSDGQIIGSGTSYAQLVGVSAVPLPAAGLMFASGILGMFGTRRRKLRASTDQK